VGETEAYNGGGQTVSCIEAQSRRVASISSTLLGTAARSPITSSTTGRPHTGAVTGELLHPLPLTHHILGILIDDVRLHSH